jgi:hypothetical protein
MFEKGYSQRPVLKPNAVPTIFNDCFGQVGCDIGLFQLLPATPLLRNPFLTLVLPWNFCKFSCKIYPISWNFHVKITLPHGISILN